MIPDVRPVYSGGRARARRPGRPEAARRDVDLSPVSGCVNREPAGVQELALEPEIARARRRRDRRSPEGRSPRGARGSGACARSRAGRSSSACSRQRLHDLEARDRLARRRRVERVARAGRAGRGRSAPRSAPTRDRGVPRTSARYARSSSRERISSCRSRVAPRRIAPRRAGRTCRGRAGGRCPGRSSSSPPSAPSASSPCDERAVARRPQPGARRGRPACRRRAGARPRTRSGSSRDSACSRVGSGISALDLLPALEPVALRPGARRRRGRRPAAISRSASAREPSSGRAARKRSSRSPASASGTRKRSVPRRGLVRSDATNEANKQPDADDDERVGEVERGPEVEVEEVRDVAEPDAVDQVRDAAADHEPERDREQRDGAAPERAKKTSIAADGAPRSARSRPSSSSAKRPNAIPEFCTWWMRERPDDGTDSPDASCATTICFVSWSATTAAPRRPRARSTGEAGAERPLGARDRLKGVRRRADANVERTGRICARRLAQPRSPAVACRRGRGWRTGSASSRSAAIAAPQTAHMP